MWHVGAVVASRISSTSDPTPHLTSSKEMGGKRGEGRILDWVREQTLGKIPVRYPRSVTRGLGTGIKRVYCPYIPVRKVK